MLFCVQSIGLPLVSSCDGCEHECCIEEVELFACCSEKQNEATESKISQEKANCCDESLDVYIQNFDAVQVVERDIFVLDLVQHESYLSISHKFSPFKINSPSLNRGPPDYRRLRSFLSSYRC